MKNITLISRLLLLWILIFILAGGNNAEVVAEGNNLRGIQANASQKLWDSQSSAAMRTLISENSDEQLRAIITSIKFDQIPLNSLAGKDGRLDKRASLASHFAYQLLQAGKNDLAYTLIAKIKTKLEKKIKVGSRPSAPMPGGRAPEFVDALKSGNTQNATNILKDHLSTDPWRIDEVLKQELYDLSMEGLKLDRPSDSALLLDAILLDYPDDLQAEFWRAAAYNNMYLNNKSDPSVKNSARRAMEAFLKKAEGNSKFASESASLKKLLRDSY